MPYEIIVGRDASDMKKFGKKGLVYLGKGYVKMGQYTSLSNPIYMDVARSHVVLVAGKRGSGKCLHGDTLITLDDGSQVPIKDLANNNAKILALNDKLKIQQAEKQEFFEREVDNLLRIKLRSGKEIKLTPEHPLFTIKGWQPAQELKIGSRIATPRKTECFGKEEMPEHQVKLLSYLLAEGHLGNGFVLFSNADEKIIEEFKECIWKFDKNLKVDIHSKPGCFRVSQKEKKIKEHKIFRNKKGQFDEGSGVRYQKSSLRLWLEGLSLYGKKSVEKEIPACIFELAKEQLALFLSRLFSCDGSIYRKKGRNNFVWEVSYSSSSNELIRQVRHLLLRFGVLSLLRKKNIHLNGKNFESYELVIGGDNVVRFIEEIGFFGRKHEKEIPALSETKLKRRSYNIDTIPKEIWETYQPENWAELGRAFGYKYPKAMRERIQYSPTRNTLLKMAEAEQNNSLYLLATSDIFWDEIVSIELLEGKFKVYDISVPEFHNFVANDIIVHNSYTLGVVAEELACLPEEVRENIASIIFDTMGIYWTMKYPNDKEKELLAESGMKPKKTPSNVVIPYGFAEDYEKRGILFDKTFALDPSDIKIEDWLLTFGLKLTEPTGVAIERNLAKLQEQGKFDIDDIIESIKRDEETEQEIKNAAIGLFEAAKEWKIFASKKQKATETKDIVKAGVTTILDISMYSSIGAFNVRALVVGLVIRKIFTERMLARKAEEIQAVEHGFDYLSFKAKREMPMVWFFIDECLTGDTEIITSRAHTPIVDIANGFEKGENFKVLAFDTEKNEFEHYPVLDVYEKGKRKVIKLITETGREITCTPEHRVLTRIKQGNVFASAFSVDNIAGPLIQHYSQDVECVKARLLGHLFGDGWACQKTQSLGFSGKKEPNDLNKIKKDLELLGFKSSQIYSRKTNSCIKSDKTNKTVNVSGISHSIQASYKSYRFFDKLGMIKGDKTLVPIRIPHWIKNSNNKIKSEFLAALFGSDGSRISEAKSGFGDFNPIRFSFNKLKSLKKEAIEYGKEILDMLLSLDINSSMAIFPANIRKDGQKTIRVVITLKKETKNMIKFLEKIGYRYCLDKENQGLKWLNYLRARVFLKNERNKIYDQAIELKKQGLGKTRIAKRLNFNEAQIRDWIYSGMKPGLPKNFPSVEMWFSRRNQGCLLFEKIFKVEEVGEEKVYDISVDKVHNFISNGFITHNCHEFLPHDYKTSATDAIVQLLREGRQPGLSLAMATQQPGGLRRDALTQSDIVIAHRVTAQPDVESLNYIMQSYLTGSIKRYLDELPTLKGSALILDDNSERIYPMRMRPRFTWHGGESPVAIKVEKKL